MSRALGYPVAFDDTPSYMMKIGVGQRKLYYIGTLGDYLSNKDHKYFEFAIVDPMEEFVVMRDNKETSDIWMLVLYRLEDEEYDDDINVEEIIRNYETEDFKKIKEDLRINEGPFFFWEEEIDEEF